MIRLNVEAVSSESPFVSVMLPARARRYRDLPVTFMTFTIPTSTPSASVRKAFPSDSLITSVSTEIFSASSASTPIVVASVMVSVPVVISVSRSFPVTSEMAPSASSVMAVVSVRLALNLISSGE